MDQAYDLAEYAVCWRPRRGGGMKRAVEQADAADEGRLEAGGSIMVGQFRGAAVIVNQGKVVRPSQLIRSVGRTVGPPREGRRGRRAFDKGVQMRACYVAALLIGRFSAPTDAAELTVGAIAGGQVLEQSSTDASAGAKSDEVTLGRTFLGGLSVGVSWGGRHLIALEGVIGPYHNDRDQGCVNAWNYGTRRYECPWTTWAATSFAVHYGVHYSVLLRSHGHSPFFGIGVGLKTYSYDKQYEKIQWPEDNTSVAIHGAAGYQFCVKMPVRVEARFVAVLNNPFLQEGATIQGQYGSATQYELQLLATVRLPIGH